MEMMRFGSNDAVNMVSKDPEKMDELPFGAILVDSTGKILKYNKSEVDISGRPADLVEGQNFFNDVAPCAKTQEFKGKFEKGVQTGTINTLFEYAFDYKMTKQKVRVHMKTASNGEGIWIFVKRL